MQILEELGTLIISVALAVVLIGVAAVMLYYFNPQQPLDHAKAAFYPLVKPLNATHVWLGIKPSADKVEVVELKYQYRWRWVDVSVARFTADRAVWLNATDGRPVAVPCSANVTIATQYGAASRAVSFTPVCLQRQPQVRDDLTVLLQQMMSYGSYVLDYVAYKSTPVLTAYFGFGSMHIGFQNVGPFPYMAVRGAPTGAGQWPPSVRAMVLTPGEHRSIENMPSVWLEGDSDDVIANLCNMYGRGACGVMHRWLNIYVYWNDILEIWINNVRVYNGTPPATAANFTAPQGFTVAFDPSAGRLEIRYPSVEYNSRRKRFVLTMRTALTLSVERGATQWNGWVRMINTSAPTSPITINQPWNVMPAGPYVGQSGGFELFGVIPPFEVYSAYAAVNGSGLVVRVGDLNCGVSEKCIRTFFYPQPGAYRIDTGINVPASLPVYIDQNYLIAITRTFRSSYCGGSNDRRYPVCASIGWYVPGAKYVVIIHEDKGTTIGYIHKGPYVCYIRTNGDIKNVAFEGRYWEIKCDHESVSLGTIRLVFNRNYTVSVYKDGQYLYNVPVYVCMRPGCGFGPWAPAQRLIIPVYWEPNSVAMNVVLPRHNPHDLGYGEGIVRMHGTQTVAMPYYYKYNLTGAYPYRLEVRINTSEDKITQVGSYVYINVTYSGYLKLYLGNKLVAYDALYGWTIKRDYAPPSSGGGSVSEPSSTCVPQVARRPKGMVHRNLVNSTDGYTVEVARRYEVRVFGCGVDRRYEETVSARVYTTTGTSYHTKDPNNKVCGFKQAQNCHGTVYCDECPPPNQQSK
jgi:hypothetical protein